LKQAKALIATGLEPKDVVSILATMLEIPPIAQDIYNLAWQVQKIELNSNTSIDALLKTMDKQG
jgi:hypothetical protein